MPSDTDARRPAVVKSRFLALKTAERLVEGYRELLSNSSSWLPRYSGGNAAGGAKILKGYEKAHAAAQGAFIRQQRVTAAAVPALHGYLTIDWMRIPEVIRALCQTFRGVTQTRFIIPGNAMRLPKDNDSSWDYDALGYTPPSGSYHSLMFKHHITDQTHFYSVDTFDMLWVLHHIGYEFPAPRCNGTMTYEGNLQFIVSAKDTAEAGSLFEEVLIKEIADAAAHPSAPSYDDYSPTGTQDSFTSTGFRSTSLSVSGSFKVKAGKKSRVWFGVAGLCTALDGYVGTNGWCYLMVKNPTGETQPGIKYAFVPD